MSVLSWPRMNFAGIFRTNPCTCNNDDVMPDVVNRDTNTLGSSVAGMSDDDILTYLRQGADMANYEAANKCYPFVRGGWNVFGDHSTNFDDCFFTSVVVEPGIVQTVKDNPGLKGLKFKLLGSKGDGSFRRADPVLVDVDPTGLVTTQLWIGGFEISVELEGQSTTIMTVDHDTRAFQDWLNFSSTVAPNGYGGQQNFVGIGAMMQFAVPADALPDVSAAHAGPVKDLMAQAQDGAGLAVRFRIFEVEPAITDQDLAAIFAKGQGMQNPAYGYLVGTLGVWDENEPRTEPAGRKLVSPYPRPDMYWAPPGGGDRVEVPKAETPWEGPPSLVGNVVALVRESPAYISLDMVSAFPKYGFRNPDGPASGRNPLDPPPGFDKAKVKADVGELELAYIPASGGDPVHIAAIDYGLDDYDTFELLGGIQDVEYDSSLYADIAAGTLVIRGTTGSRVNAGTTLVQEEVLRVVVDDRSAYVAPSAAEVPLRLRVYERGGPPSSDVVILPQEYCNIIQVDSSPNSGCSNGFRPNQTTHVRPATDHRLAYPASITYRAGSTDWMTVTVKPQASGAAILNFQFDDQVWGPSVPEWSTANYTTIRIYTDDDFSHLHQAGDLQWDDVYENVLRYYYVLFPFMSTIIPLNLPSSILRYAEQIKQRLHKPDEPGFYTTFNMPVTRTMSPAKVQLLLDWIAQQQQPGSERKVVAE